MSIEELEQEVKRMFEPQKEEVEKKFDEWSALMKEATIMLSNWDTDTEEGLRQIDDVEQKQVEEDKNLLECHRMWFVPIDQYFGLLLYLLRKVKKSVFMNVKHRPLPQMQLEAKILV